MIAKDVQNLTSGEGVQTLNESVVQDQGDRSQFVAPC